MKNEIPIGSTIDSTGRPPIPMLLSASSVESTKKPRYLKTPSRVRFEATATVTQSLRRA